jgi:hypothetical protein
MAGPACRQSRNAASSAPNINRGGTPMTTAIVHFKLPANLDAAKAE